MTLFYIYLAITLPMILFFGLMAGNPIEFLASSQDKVSTKLSLIGVYLVSFLGIYLALSALMGVGLDITIQLR